MQRILTAQALEDTLNEITFLVPKNTLRKNAFLAVCYSLNNEINLRYVNEFAEFGGLIGPGNSKLDFFVQMFQSISASCNFSCCFWIHEK